MNNFYATKKRLTSLCLLAIGLVSFNANSQCTAVTQINEDFDTWQGNPMQGNMAIDACWSTIANAGMVYGDENVTFYGGQGSTVSMFLISPEIVSGTYSLSFSAIAVPAGPNPYTVAFEVGTVASTTDASTFTSSGAVETVNHQAQTITRNITITSTQKYVAIKVVTANPHNAASVDDFVLASSASAPKFDTSKVTVYPNPTSGIFNVDSELNIAQIEVFNATGQKVLATANKEINLQSAANGLYFVTVTTNEGTQGTYKLIKK